MNGECALEYTLRDIQLCELQILKDIKKVCDRHHIRYYLCGGTLLGAVRHKGFIPWDDDVDIQIPYDDYLRFLEVAQDELGPDYFVQTDETDSLYPLAYTHIRKNNTALMVEGDKHIRSHHGVWVDVFPMTCVRSRLDYRVKRAAVKMCYYLRVDEATFALDRERYTAHSSAMTVGAISLVRRLPESFRARWRRRTLDWILRGKKGSYICYLWVKLSRLFPKEFYGEKPVLLQFEDDIYPAPGDYDRYLTLEYGDYMTPPPPEKRSGRHGMYAIVDLEHNWTDYCN